MKHSLTNKDTTALVAECSVCGTGAGIAKAGRGWVCREARREAQRAFRAAHPERVREWKKRPPSKHRLTKRDGTPDTCAICGPVTPVVMGRGWGCPVRAKEIGRKNFADAPQPKCLLCSSCYLDRFGACPKCDEPEDDSMYLPTESRAYQRMNSVAAMWEDAGFSIVGGESRLDSDYQSVVPGWKTLGSDIPERDGKVLDTYAVLYGSGSR